MGSLSPSERPPASLVAPISAIERGLERVIDSFDLADALRDAVRYSVLSGGKRVRPVICWHASRACGSPGEVSLPACCALELVHCFSLVHDDLPAMDDDDLRRGKPTLHIAMGEGLAILAGDAMMPLAFRALGTGGHDHDLATRMQIELAECTLRMINGQVHDTLGGLEDLGSDEARLLAVHSNKTGALIEAACRLGGIAAGGDDSRIDALGRFGEAVGWQFQLVDDLLDVERTSEETGKRTGKDAEAGKLTAVGVYGIDGVRREIAASQERAEAALEGFGAEAEDLRTVARWLGVRGK